MLHEGMVQAFQVKALITGFLPLPLPKPSRVRISAKHDRLYRFRSQQAQHIGELVHIIVILHHHGKARFVVLLCRLGCEPVTQAQLGEGWVEREIAHLLAPLHKHPAKQFAPKVNRGEKRSASSCATVDFPLAMTPITG